jgi:hypothetical protein
MDPVVVLSSEQETEPYYSLKEEDFTNFKEYCILFRKRFGLFNWNLVFDRRDLSDTDALAQVNWDIEGHSARVTLSTVWCNWEDMDVKEELKRVALHEMIHLVLARYQEYATRRFGSPSDMDEALEEAIRLIENIYEAGYESGSQRQQADPL